MRKFNEILITGILLLILTGVAFTVVDVIWFFLITTPIGY